MWEEPSVEMDREPPLSLLIEDVGHQRIRRVLGGVPLDEMGGGRVFAGVQSAAKGEDRGKGYPTWYSVTPWLWGEKRCENSG